MLVLTAAAESTQMTAMRCSREISGFGSSSKRVVREGPQATGRVAGLDPLTCRPPTRTVLRQRGRERAAVGRLAELEGDLDREALRAGGVE